VRVVWQAPADVLRSSPEQVRPDAVTNFGQFHRVPFGEGGTVDTVSMFDNTAQRSPSSQICWYVERADSLAKTAVTIGRDGRMDLPATAPAGVDLRAAYYQLCDWKPDGAKPAPVTPSNANLIRAKN